MARGRGLDSNWRTQTASQGARDARRASFPLLAQRACVLTARSLRDAAADSHVSRPLANWAWRQGRWGRIALERANDKLHDNCYGHRLPGPRIIAIP